MKKSIAQFIIVLFIGTILVLSYLFIFDFAYLNKWNRPIDSEKFAEWGSAISGLMATGAFVFAFISFLNQYKSTAKQEIENNFFRLIENLQFIINQTSLSIPLDDEIIIADTENNIKWKAKRQKVERVEGRVALRTMLVKLKKDLYTYTTDDLFEELFKDLTSDALEQGNYQEFYDNHFYILGHYFRYVYNILKYIDSAKNIDEKEKTRLTDLLQAQLSSDEMGLIFYNAIFNDKAKKKLTGERKFLELLERYKILENIDDKSLARISHKKTYYPKTFK